MTELKVLHHQGTDKGTICVIMFIVVIVFVYYPFYFILYKRFLTRDTELSDSILEIISILEPVIRTQKHKTCDVTVTLYFNHKIYTPGNLTYCSAKCQLCMTFVLLFVNLL